MKRNLALAVMVFLTGAAFSASSADRPVADQGKPFDIRVVYVESIFKSVDAAEDALAQLQRGKDFPRDCTMQSVAFSDVPWRKTSLSREVSYVRPAETGSSAQPKATLRYQVECDVAPMDEDTLTCSLRVDYGGTIPVVTRQDNAMTVRDKVIGLQISSECQLKAGSRSVVHTAMETTDKGILVQFVTVAVERPRR